MDPDRGKDRRPSDDDLRRYLAARADAASRRAGTDMPERVAVSLGLIQGRRRGQARVLRLAVVVAAVLVTLLAVGFGTGVLTPPGPSPTPAPTRDPAFTPQVLQGLPDVAFTGATQIGADATSVWVADLGGSLAELDPSTGDVLRTTDLPSPASDLLVTADSVWVSSAAALLVRVDRTTLAITPIPAAVGVALAAGPSGIWLGGSNEVLRIDLASNAVTLRIPVTERSADLGVAVTDGDVWVATLTQILRLNPADGSVRSSIGGDASRLAVASGAVWATRGTELIRIDAGTGQATAIVAGLPSGIALSASAAHLWAAGPPGGGGVGTVVGASSIDGWIELTGAVPASVLDVAAGVGTLWITPDEGAAGPSIFRFTIP